MALGIIRPTGETDCNSATGKVCVKGDGAKKGPAVAKNVYAKIYKPGDPDPVNPSQGPPADAASTVPDSGGAWRIGLLGVATCSNDSPYPVNKVWAWAEYDVSSSSTSEEFIYEVASRSFEAVCQTGDPPCST